jgi:hypothetical protein
MTIYTVVVTLVVKGSGKARNGHPSGDIFCCRIAVVPETLPPLPPLRSRCGQTAVCSTGAPGSRACPLDNRHGGAGGVSADEAAFSATASAAVAAIVGFGNPLVNDSLC